MKFFAILAAVSLAQAAKLDRVYLPPNAQAASGSDNTLQTPYQSANGDFDLNGNAYANDPTPNANNYAENDFTGFESRSENDFSGFESRPERTQAAFERNAAILRQDNSNDGETYSYAYETENGIYAEENGVATNGVQAQGGYTYTGDDGKVYSVRYTADENGFVPQGDHLPTSPPIPEEILKALEKNARDEAAGIYDDGSYSEVKYAAASNDQQQYYNTNAQPTNYNTDAQPSNYNTDGQTSNYNTNAQPSNYNTDAQASNYKTNAQPSNFNNDAQSTNNYNTNAQLSNNYNTEAQQSNYNTDAQQSNYNTNAQPTNNYNIKGQPTNYNDDSVSTNSAGFGKAADFNGNSVEKAYLPPVVQRNNNQRNSDSRNGYQY